MENKRLPQLCDDTICTGCASCINSCRESALILVQNIEGFYRPHLNAAKCIGCGLCEKCCPILNPIKRQSEKMQNVYACWHKDTETRYNSSSGGAFSALAETILEDGGFVVGAAYDEELCVKHIIIESKSELDKLRLSKYVQSRIDADLFVSIKMKLSDGQKGLFVGTPCQCAGLRASLRKEYDNLVIVDIICHGVPSKLMLDKYKEWLEPLIGKVTHINFRNKNRGWYFGQRTARIEGGKLKYLRGKKDAYFTCFNKNNCLQHSCYDCRFQNFPRYSDLTIADFWKIGMVEPFGHKDEIKNGISMIITSNKKAVDFVIEAKDKMEMFERTMKEAIRGNHAGVESSHKPTSRKSIYEDITTLDYTCFINKYANLGFKKRLIQLFKQRCPSSLVNFIKLMQQK